ncbi:MAG: tetratricopeptide repeat protein [Bacteroidia bacterium]
MISVKKIVAGLSLVFTFTGLFSQNDNTVLMAYNKSSQLEKKKDYAGALEAMKGIDNSSYEANLRMGWLSYKAGLHAAALGYYENAVKQMPNSIEAKYGYNYPAYELGNMDKVIEQYKKILEIDPQNTQVIFNLGSIYYYKHDLKAALPYFEKMVALYPFDYDGLSMLAWTNLKLDKKAEAKALFEKVLLNVPGDQAAMDELSHIKDGAVNQDQLYLAFMKNYEFLNKQDYKSAIAVLKEVYDSTSYELNARLGWLNYAAGLHKESIAYYKRAINLKPKALEPKFGIDYPLAALGNTNQLIEQYQAILMIDPQNTIANYRLGYISYEKKDYPEALKYFGKLVEHYPFGYDGLLMYAWANFRTGKTAEAKALFNKVLWISPGDKSALEGLSLIK